VKLGFIAPGRTLFSPAKEVCFGSQGCARVLPPKPRAQTECLADELLAVLALRWRAEEETRG